MTGNKICNYCYNEHEVLGNTICPIKNRFPYTEPKEKFFAMEIEFIKIKESEKMSNTIKMMALSWKQPYAGLMLPPHNKIETRTWDTTYRGLVLICASKQPYKLDVIKQISGEEQFMRILDCYQKQHFASGEAIGVGTLVDSRPMKKEDEAKCFVQYHPDLFCHVYENVRRIESFAWKGSQGWRKVSEEIINQIKYI